MLQVRSRRVISFAAALAFLAACAPRGPVLDPGADPPAATGTISGTVRAAGTNAPLSARKVTATELTTGARYEASTSTGGGYTMKVPTGRYRLEVELRDGEVVDEAPAELSLNPSDMDAGRDFTIAVRRPGAAL